MVLSACPDHQMSMHETSVVRQELFSAACLFAGRLLAKRDKKTGRVRSRYAKCRHPAITACPPDIS